MTIRPAVALATLVAASLPASAQLADTAPSPWQVSARGGYVHQFEADLDDGGEVSVDRAFAQVGLGYGVDPRTSFGLQLGYRYDAFDFGGDGALTALGPWGDIQELRLSAPVGFGITDRIDGFLSPQLSWSAETGAGFGEALSGGAIAGAAYRINDRLLLGAGLGAFSEIEGDGSFFPVLLIDWQVTDAFAITTTPSVGITRGPTINANWTPVENWRFTLGGGYESYRFRLEEDDRVGEEKSFPLFAAASYEPLPQLEASLVGGVFLGGELRLEDSDGNLIAKESYDPAPFVGVALNARF